MNEHPDTARLDAQWDTSKLDELANEFKVAVLAGFREDAYSQESQTRAYWYQRLMECKPTPDPAASTGVCVCPNEHWQDYAPDCPVCGRPRAASTGGEK